MTTAPQPQASASALSPFGMTTTVSETTTEILTSDADNGFA